MAIPRRDHAAIVVGNHVYLLGGAGTSALDGIERATLVNNGEVQPPALAGSDFAVTAGGLLGQPGASSVGPLLRSGHSAVTVGNYLYIVGGVDMNGAPVQRSISALQLFN